MSVLLPLAYLLTPLAQDTLYLNNNHELCGETEARYYRIEQGNGRGQSYTFDHILHRKGQMIDGKPHGQFVYYHPNGAVKSIQYFDQGKKMGRWQWWYDNGLLMEEGYWEVVAEGQSERERFKLKSYYNRIGYQLIKNGNGTYIQYDENGKITAKGTYSDGFLVGDWTRTDASDQVAMED